MDHNESPKNPVNLSITREGDFTFSGHVSEYDVALILDAWRSANQIQQQSLKTASTVQWWVEFLGRFSGLFPLVILVMFLSFVFSQCNRPQPTLHQPVYQQGWDNAQ